MSYAREEIERTFASFIEAIRAGMASGEWEPWSRFYTEDAVYVEHAFGTFAGRAEILEWMREVMRSPVLRFTAAFECDWHMVCPERGWVVAQFATRMRDPGDGAEHRSYCYTRLEYAGNGQWRFEEDIYNPESMRRMLDGWVAAKLATVPA